MKKSNAADIRRRAEKINVLLLDVDGVLTDGSIIMDDRGTESKHFNVRDGHGIKMILRSGMEVIFLTGRTSRVVSHRARDLGVREVYQGVRDKAGVFESLMRRKGMTGESVAYVGDDIVDVPLFRRVGLSIAVADACEEAKRTAHHITKKKGGKGAVREVCEMLLRVQGKWKEAVARYDV